MSIDYGTYELSRRQKVMFFTIGYLCLSASIFLFFRSPLLSFAAGFLAFALLPRFSSALAASRRKELQSQFKDLLSALSSSIESGRQMEEALVEAPESLKDLYEPDAPIMVELEYMRRGIEENNESDVHLLEDLARRSGSEDIRNFVDVYLACRSSGSDMEDMIAHTTAMMRDKMEINEQIAVITAQKRLEGRIISAMPLAMLLALNVFSPTYISVLYEGFMGRLVMFICLIGICVGIGLMERLSDVEA